MDTADTTHICGQGNATRWRKLVLPGDCVLKERGLHRRQVRDLVDRWLHRLEAVPADRMYQGKLRRQPVG